MNPNGAVARMLAREPEINARLRQLEDFLGDENTPPAAWREYDREYDRLFNEWTEITNALSTITRYSR